jgi:hypothetical protein
MNTQHQKINQTSDQEESSLPANDFSELCEPVGSFAGPRDFVLRIRKGKAVPADTGEQGGGQN